LLGGTTAASQFTNTTTSTTNIPKIYPYWDDLSTGTNGSVKTLVTGSAPNRIFKVQWTIAVPRTSATGDAANATFQAWLYEGSGQIEFRYGTMGTPTSGSISAGLTGSPATNFNSITFSANTASSITANDLNTTAPASGRIYTFNPPGGGITYAWAPSASVVNATNQNTATSPIASTTVFTVTATNGLCSVTATTTVNTEPLSCLTPTASATLCSGTNFTVTANVTGGGTPYSYAWSDGSTNVYTSTSSIAANLPAGSYTFTCTVTDACNNTCSSSVPVTVNSLPPVAVNPTSGLICNPGGSAITINASGAASYSWTPTTGLTPSTGSVVSANPSSNTTYTVTGTDGNGCVAKATSTISLSTAVVLTSVTASNPSVCSGGSSTLTANASFNSSVYCTPVYTSYDGTDYISLDPCIHCDSFAGI
jgi:hypothetical protein